MERMGIGSKYRSCVLVVFTHFVCIYTGSPRRTISCWVQNCLTMRVALLFVQVSWKRSKAACACFLSLKWKCVSKRGRRFSTVSTKKLKLRYTNFMHVVISVRGSNIGRGKFYAVRNEPADHPASFTMHTGSLSRGVRLTSRPHLASRLKKE